jgi:hypothetical protein
VNAVVNTNAPLSPTIDEAAVERPPSTARTISQPVVPVANGEGNLFYAYARKVRLKQSYGWMEARTELGLCRATT